MMFVASIAEYYNNNYKNNTKNKSKNITKNKLYI